MDSDLTAIADRRPPGVGLFDDDDDEPTQEISSAVLQQATAANGELDLDLPASSNEEVLPVYMPARRTTPRPTEAPPPPPAPEAPPPIEPPDLSVLLDGPSRPASRSTHQSPAAAELFGDVTGVHVDPPPGSPSPPPGRRSDHGLDLLPPPPPPSTGSGSRPRFASGLTGGMQPLDVAQFEAPEPQGGSRKKKKSQVVGTAYGRPAPMAGSKRMVRRPFQIGLRDLLLLVLIVLIGVGLWVGWSIYQDYSRRADWQRFDQGRARLEQTRTDAIERTQPKKTRDVP